MLFTHTHTHDTHLDVEVSSVCIDSVTGEADSSCAFPQNSRVPLQELKRGMDPGPSGATWAFCEMIY